MNRLHVFQFLDGLGYYLGDDACWNRSSLIGMTIFIEAFFFNSACHVHILQQIKDWEMDLQSAMFYRFGQVKLGV